MDDLIASIGKRHKPVHEVGDLFCLSVLVGARMDWLFRR